MAPTETIADQPATTGRGSTAVDVVFERMLGAAGIVAATLFAVLMALFASFLVPLRIGSVPVPLAWGVAVVGTALPVWFARYTAGTAWATAVPAMAWFAVAIAMTTRTAEGDLIVLGTWVGYGTPLLGAATLTVGIYLAATARTRSGHTSRRLVGTD